MCALDGQIILYEINTWVWLAELSEKHECLVDLSSVPATEWDLIAQYGFNAVWLMGVWERSPAGIAIANQDATLVAEFRRVLPDFHSDDNVGSAYCVRRYVVDTHLGGSEGLAVARKELARRGMGLLLDYVPNHMAPDAPWIMEQPEHFIQGTVDDLQHQPDAYLAIGGKVFARGRDPYFPPWPDVVQVNAFHAGFRAAVVALILRIAQQCDGIRCDMAMLTINNIFARTWGGTPPADEFWPWVIHAVKQQRPDFLFVAEAYWDLEWTLQQQGFDLCYDKRFYDLLEQGDGQGVQRHLSADLSYQQKLLRFVENHDEPRAAAAFSAERARGAAITLATVAGAKLFHEGQLEGRKLRVPVFLGRRPAEPADGGWQNFYRQLFTIMTAAVFRAGQWAMCACTGWPDNQSCQQLGAWCWRLNEERRLILVNLTAATVQARVHLPWKDLAGRTWRLADGLSPATYDRNGDEIEQAGLYVELAPWVGQILTVQALRS